MYIMLTVEDLKDLAGKKVYVRVDFNVPQKNGVIRDNNRIKAALPTINYLSDKGARLILMSHLGKIKWKDLGMPYGGNIPDELNDMIDSIAETYLKNHPELIKDKYKGKW